MSILTIYYEAKCKHCKFFKQKNILKKDGTPSKKMISFCNNIYSNTYNEYLTLKSKACSKIEL